MSIKRISLAIAAAALSAGFLTTVGTPAQAAPVGTADTTAHFTATKPKPNYKPIPAKATTKHGVARKGLDFGFLTKVTLKDGTLKVRFDRAEYYDGKAAADRNGGEIPADDYLITNGSKKLRTFTVSKKASLIGTYDLLGQPESNDRKKISRKALVKNFKKSDTRVPVWVRHTNGDNGTITALAEQFTP